MTKLLMFITALSAAAILLNQQVTSDLVYQWKEFDYNWTSPQDEQAAVDSGTYVQSTNVPSGMAVYKENIYFALPRLAGVPATVASVSRNEPLQSSPRLQPYPNWDMQRNGSCDAFYSAQDLEIDNDGRMWVVDSGEYGTITSPKLNYICKPKLVILDLEGGGKQLTKYEFPESVVGNSSFLFSIVLDGSYAYISDNSPVEPGIVVVVLENNKISKSWKIHNSHMFADKAAGTFTVDGTSITMSYNIHGLALSPIGEAVRYIYYCPIASLSIFAIELDALKMSKQGDEVADVVFLENKGSQSDGMMMSANNDLIFGRLTANAVASIDATVGAKGEQVFILDENNQTIIWPAAFAFDEFGYLWFVANSLQRFNAEIQDKYDYNIYLHQIFMGIDDYQNAE